MSRIAVTKVRTLSGRTGSISNAAMSRERKIKGISATHRVIMVLLDLPELGSTNKVDI